MLIDEYSIVLENLVTSMEMFSLIANEFLMENNRISALRTSYIKIMTNAVLMNETVLNFLS